MSGACRNGNDSFNDLGRGDLDSIKTCQQSCDEKQGCIAVSWDGNSCYMTSQVAYTTSEPSWKCYAKGVTN